MLSGSWHEADPLRGPASAALFLAALPIPAYIRDRRGIYVFANDAWLALFEKRIDEVVQQPLERVWPPDLASRMAVRDASSLEMGAGQFEETLPLPSGPRRFNILQFRIAGAEGVEQIGGMLFDVSAREPGCPDPGVLAGAFDGCWLIEPSGRIADADARFCALTGCDREELIGHDIGEFEVDSGPGRIQERIDTVRARGSTRFETQYRRRDGTVADVEVFVRFLPGEQRAYGFVRDISGQKRIEASLRQASAEHAAILNTVADGIHILDQDGNLVRCNEAFARMLGYTEEETAGLNVAEWDAQWTREELRSMVRVLFDKSAVFETRHRRKDGSLFDAEVSARALLIGSRSLLFASSRDITSRKRAAAVLSESEARFRTLVENAPEGIFIMTGGRFRYVNPAAIALFGVDSSARLVGTPVLEHIHPADYETPSQSLADLLANKPAQMLEKRFRRGDGGFFIAEVLAVPFAYGGENGGLVFFRDVTRRRQIEHERELLAERFREAQHLESIGRLAGRVAHDFNNQLTVINGYSSLLLHDLPPGSPLRTRVEEIRSAGEQAAALTNQLLAFSRRQVVRPSLLDLSEVVRESLPLLGRLAGATVRIEADLSPGLWILAEPAQIAQILMNLVENARIAMPDGGTVRISTRRDEPSRPQPPVPEKTLVVLEVSDTGLGMDENTRKHIFEPFFRTNTQGVGSGLGLSIVYAIVTQYGGCVDVESSQGQGSRFCLYFPWAGGETGPAPEKPLPVRLRGSETVLVVEDHSQVRTFVVESLASYGYHVVAASCAEEGLELLARSAREADILVTDLILPGMNGRDFAEKARYIRPELRVLYMSGYAANLLRTVGDLPPGDAFMSKPFNPEELARQVRAALDSGPGR
jgi:two-component system cell cycle sensor histidine kinase/response regulator CckA